MTELCSLIALYSLRNYANLVICKLTVLHQETYFKLICYYLNFNTSVERFHKFNDS